MACILQIESSTEICSVSIAKDGVIISIIESAEPNIHTEYLTPFIRDVISDSHFRAEDLDAVAVSSGPGSYTSLRVGAATAKAMCYALNLPLITLNSLTALAYGVPRDKMGSEDIIIPMIDARRMEVYASVLDYHYNPQMETKPIILDNHSFDGFKGRGLIHICGNGAQKYYDNFENSQLLLHHTSASSQYMTIPVSEMYKKEEFADVAYFSPEYVKGANVIKSTKKIF